MTYLPLQSACLPLRHSQVALTRNYPFGAPRRDVGTIATRPSRGRGSVGGSQERSTDRRDPLARTAEASRGTTLLPRPHKLAVVLRVAVDGHHVLEAVPH